MFFILGTRPQTRELRTLTMVCWKCSQASAHRLTQVKNQFTLFFIPLLPLSTTRILQCLLCGADQRLTPEQVEDILALPAPENSEAP